MSQTASFLKLLTKGLVVISATASAVQVRPSTMEKRALISTKRGAAYNDATLVSALSSNPNVISWAYNWASTVNGDIPSGEEYVPMLWGSGDVDGWAAAVKTALANGSTHLLGFNEPDSSLQSDMSYLDAARYYKEYITIYSQDATLVSPAVTSSTASGEGLSWLSSFLSECTDCEISAIAVHWYGSTLAELQTFVNEADNIASHYGISELWLTEFGLDTDESGITDLAVAARFVNEASTWLDTYSAIARYAFFYCADGWMLTNGVANSVGNAYVSNLATLSSTRASSSWGLSSSQSTSLAATISVSNSQTSLLPSSSDRNPTHASGSTPSPSQTEKSVAKGSIPTLSTSISSENRLFVTTSPLISEASDVASSCRVEAGDGVIGLCAQPTACSVPPGPLHIV